MASFSPLWTLIKMSEGYGAHKSTTFAKDGRFYIDLQSESLRRSMMTSCATCVRSVAPGCPASVDLDTAAPACPANLGRSVAGSVACCSNTGAFFRVRPLGLFSGGEPVCAEEELAAFRFAGSLFCAFCCFHFRKASGAPYSTIQYGIHSVTGSPGLNSFFRLAL